MKQPQALVVGALVGALTLTGCSVYDAPLPGGPDTGDDPIQVTARFRDVLDLVPQSTVKLDDVDVGKVTAVKLDGYVAEVTLSIRDDVELPGNTAAQIRQTSLLGEKFVSLEQPEETSGGALGDGDVIGLDRTGRNPELEEVFSALALLLNGGGVGQLRTITRELNNAFDGRTEEIKSVLTQIDTFIGALDDDKAAIVAALENTNRLAARARNQQTTIENALDDVPPALRSLERQREDLVRLLEALTRLSDVGTRVIRASKESTINSLRDLGPVLNGLADAGDALPKALQVYLTYPFIDETVGRDPQVARNLNMGDYTNLSVDLDLDLFAVDLPELPIDIPDVVCDTLADGAAAVRATRARFNRAVNQTVRPVLRAIPTEILPAADRADELERIRTELEDRLDLDALLDAAQEACEAASIDPLVQQIEAQLEGDLLTALGILEARQLQRLLNGTLGDALGGGGNGGGGGGDDILGGGGGDGGGDGGGGLGGLGLPRTAPGYDDPAQIDPFGISSYGLDPGIGTLLLQGVATKR